MKFKSAIPVISVIVIALSTILFFQNCGTKDFNAADYSSKGNPPPPPPPPGPGDCTLPNGDTALEGAEVDFYSKNSAACGETCPSQKLKCEAKQFKDAAGIVVDITGLNLTCTKLYCDARNSTTNQLTNLVAGKPYLVSVYGVTASRGQDGATLTGVRVTDCNNAPLAAVPNTSMNWHDGQAPHSGFFSIMAPSTGCIRGFTDNGNALMISALERPNSGGNLAGSSVILTANTNYLIAVHGHSENRGSGSTTFFPTQIVQTGTVVPLVGDSNTLINWPDGAVPASALFAFKTGANSTVSGMIDGSTINALSLSFFEAKSPSQTVNTNSVSGLTPGKKYYIQSYGFTTNRGEGVSTTLQPIRMVDCANAGTILAATPSVFINWHDGQAPQSAALVVTAPASGCVRSTNDGVVKLLTSIEVD